MALIRNLTKDVVNVFFIYVYLMDIFSSQDITNELQDDICETGFLLCPNTSHICIPQYKYCNNKQDCPENTDENPDLCYDHYQTLYFDRMFSKNPSAIKDDLDPGCKLNYEGPCLCRHNDLLCKNSNLRELPALNPNDSIDILDVSGNFFEEITMDITERIPNNVQKFVLKHCEVRTISEGSFFRLSSLQELYLDNNNLRILDKKVFGKINLLIKLVLRYNKIKNIHKDFFGNLRLLEFLDLSYNEIKILNSEIFEHLENLVELDLRGNKLKEISKQLFHPNLQLNILSLMENQIENIEFGSFGNLRNLKTLELDKNRLKILKNGTFENLTSLTSLTLKENMLDEFEAGVFAGLINLESLNLDGNFYQKLSKSLFKCVKNLKHIYFRRFEMCNYTPYIKDCQPKDDGISSNKHLLHNPLLRASVWIMASIGCLGNAIVLLGRILTKTNNAVHSFYIKNLALSDFLMGIYLFTIAFMDRKYRGVYLEHEYEWRHSSTCNLCGFLSTLSSVSSVFILSLVTYDRFISVTKPLIKKQASKKTALLQLLFLWIISFIISFLPISGIGNHYFENFYNNNGVCLPLHIHEPFQKGWLYSTSMFVFLNTIALIFISYAYAKMTHEIRKSGLSVRSNQRNNDKDKVAKRFGIIVLTDCLCWIPIIVVKICALLGINISKYLYAWLAIFILPINSALNPVLYTLTTTAFKKQMRKTFKCCVKPKKKTSNFDSGSSMSLNQFPKGSNRKGLNYRGTQTSLMTSSYRKPTAV